MTTSTARLQPPTPPDLQSVAMDAIWTPATVRDLVRWIEASDRFIRSIPRQFIEQVDFTAGTTPTKRIGTSVAPRGVVALALDNMTTNASAQPPQPLRWSFDQGVLTFSSLSSLAGSDQHRFRFLVVEAA